jgi:hypothetical protein
VLCVFLDERCFARAVDRGDVAWKPGSETLDAFARREVEAPLDSGFVFLSWPPAQRVFGERIEAAEAEIRRVLRERQGSLVTEGYFGRAWIRNVAVNAVAPTRFWSLRFQPGAVVIAASGPRLEHAIPDIRRYRERFALWALPSALLPLRSAGIAPDLVVLTDPGFYAGCHLEPLRELPGTPVLMPLTAARGTWRVAARPVLIQQDFALERSAVARAGLPASPLEPNGTVAGTAIAFAERHGMQPVFTAGLDLCTEDIHTHARPQVLDRYLQRKEGRLSPELTARYTRIRGMRRLHGRSYASSALETYTEWFRRQAGAGTGEDPPCRLFPSPVQLPFPKCSPEALAEQRPARQELRAEPTPGRAERNEAIRRLLGELDEIVERSFSLLREQLPDSPEDAASELKLLRALDLPRVLRARRAIRRGEEDEARREASELERDAHRFLADLRGRMARAAEEQFGKAQAEGTDERTE